MKKNVSRTTATILLCSLALLLSCCKPPKTDFKPMYMEPIYEVAEEQGRVYAQNVEGYWSSYPDTREDFGKIYTRKIRDLVLKKNLDLDMDIYYPKEPAAESRRPLLVLIHGGAFYNGDKQDIGYPEMGHYFAERGYVVASINYRLGFFPLAPSVDRAGYRALQDAHAAVCYLIANADEFSIDTTNIFAAGTSAGAITALNLAFMEEKNRPESTKQNGVKGWISAITKTITEWLDKGINVIGSIFGQDWGINGDNLCEALGLNSDLGPINAVSGPQDRPFKIKAVVNMWGAVHDLSMISNSKETSILAFHGDADQIVPYGDGYPFDNVLDPYVDVVIDALPDEMSGLAEWMKDWITNGKPINEWAFNPMHGSKSIHDKASTMSMRSELHTLKGAGHSLHVCEDRESLSNYFNDTILPQMTRFLCEEMAGGPIVQIVKESDGWYKVNNTENVAELYWVVEGGKVAKKDGKYRVRVKFNDETTPHSVTACGQYKNGVEFREKCN